jgi:hypothetical protein
MDEKEVTKYLKKSKDNVIIVFGQKIHCVKRSKVREMLSNPMFCYTGEDTQRYYQILGRPLLSRENMNKILDAKYSIFNISLLVNVIKVFSDQLPHKIHNRSIYNVDAYNYEEYMSI